MTFGANLLKTAVVACGDEILSLEICDGGDNVLICLHLKGMQIGLIEHQQG